MAKPEVEQHIEIVGLTHMSRFELETLPRSLGRGFWIWLPRVAEYDDPARTFTATLVVGMDEDGNTGFSSITILPRLGQVVRPGDSQLPLAALAVAIMRALPKFEGPVLPPGAFRAMDMGTYMPADADDRAGALRQASRSASVRRARNRVTPDRLRRVADAYRDPPEDKTRRQAVADAEGLSVHAAAKLIARARDEGYLGPSPRERQAGEVESPRSRAPKKGRTT